MERFSCKTKIISGAGSLSALKELKIRRLLIVTDPYFHQNGTAQRIARLTGAEEICYFHKIVPDPSVELAAEGTAQLRSFQPDTVIALGGGSAMDCAKAMVYFAGLEIPLIAIPTTSGSGSEVTDFAILTHKGVKHPLVDEKIRPNYAILDSDLLKELPKSLIADCGFDVLSHALEACVAKNASPITDALAKDAFTAVFSSLPASFAGDLSVRQKIHTASTMAGLAFTQAGLGLCHALSHSLGGLFHIPHGRLNAILLPSVIACNAHAAGEKYASLSRYAGLGGSVDTLAVRNLRNGLIRLRRELNLPETLAQAGVDPKEVRFHSNNIVSAALADPCCATNPIGAEDFMIRRILEEVTGRG